MNEPVTHSSTGAPPLPQRAGEKLIADRDAVRHCGIVAIGRNEGRRLRQCLRSVLGGRDADDGLAQASKIAPPVIYVDSGSTDGSQALARQMGATVVELDMSIPFTAARARNIGMERLMADHKGLQFVQFIDGDCEMTEGWLAAAASQLQSRDDLAAVCGRVRERHPERSIYNRLCDIEWDTPIGEADACGGIALMRIDALRQVNGFNPALIAGEEPELCVRLRQNGWKILRIDRDMALHDADMTRLGQWWKRNLRAGHACAEGAALHGRSPQRHGVRQMRSNFAWGLALPLAVIALAWPTGGISFALLGGYGLLFWRIRRAALRCGMTRANARLYAFFCTLGKFPQMLGQCKYYFNRIRGHRGRLIEYKTTDNTSHPDHSAGHSRHGRESGTLDRQIRIPHPIAYLVNQYPQSSQSFIRREIAALEALGLRVERFTLRRWNVPLVDEEDQAEQARTRAVLEAGIATLGLAAMWTIFTRPLKFARAAWLAMRIGWRSERGLALHGVYLAEACLLSRWLAESSISHVHAHFGTNSTAVAMLCHALGGPSYSFTAHGPEEFDLPQFLGLGEKIRRAAFVVAISEFGRSQLCRWCGHEQWAKIHIVRCGVDAAFLSRELLAPPIEPRLVCVGRLAEQKGQLVLIEAAGRLKAEGMDFHLTLVGDGPMRSRIESLIDQLGLDAQVRIAGWMSNEQVRREITSARAMVLPSFAEGLPVVIMEALALGRPVISTYVAGIPELVEPAVNGWLVSPGSVNALTEAMRQALQADVAELARMGQAGSRRVRQNHNAACEAKKLAELLEKHVAKT